LHRHISQSYKFDIFSGGFVEILAAEQTVSRSDWFQGTADAVRRNLWHFLSYDFDYYLILAGDHLYRMDYRKFVQFHARKGADISVAVYPVEASEAPGFGILKIDKGKQIVDFVEKPRDSKTLARMRVPGRGRSKSSKDFLASMGIYVFSRKTLHDVLANEEHTDFGRDIIPSSLSQRRVMAYPFTGYWRDIGTIRAFFDANIEMAQPNPPFPFHTEEGPIYTHPRFLQGSRIEDCQIRHSTIAPGGTLCGASLDHCVIGIRSTVSQGCLLDHVVMMGADYREWPSDKAANRKANIPNIGIGENSRIRNAIIDKNARIGENVVIENRERSSKRKARLRHSRWDCGHREECDDSLRDRDLRTQTPSLAKEACPPGGLGWVKTRMGAAHRLELPPSPSLAKRGGAIRFVSRS
jgi:glucose-1-phosphate adenylyltransferase